MSVACVGCLATRLSAILPAFLLGLASCARLPVAEAPVPADVVAVPAAWSTGVTDTGAPATLVRWWTRFDDALLDGLVRDALQANTGLATARANVLQARALRDLAAAALWPSLTGSASVQQGSAGGHSTGRQVDLGLSAGWVPDVFGANRAALAVARSTLQASLADAGSSAVAVTSEVGLAYLLLREGQARVAIAADNLASQRDTLQIASWREQAGLATSLDTAQARTAVEQTQALLPPLQVGVGLAQHALAVLTGRAPAALQAVLDPVRGLPRAATVAAPSIPADTLRQRADVQAAGLRVSAALARVSQAEAARFPGFALTGTLGVGATGAASLFNAGAVLTSVLASVTAPLFDGGALRAEVRAQQAALELARVGYRATVLAALKDVEDGLLTLAGDRERLTSLQSAADAAALAAQMSRQRFASGLVDFQVVLETQRTQLSTQDGLAIGTADVGSDLVRLYVALGGGWQEDPADGRDEALLANAWVWSP